MMMAIESRRRGRALGKGAAALALVCVASLAAALPLLAQEEHGEGAGGGGLFAINPGLVIWTWVIFLILLFVLRKWAWGPILGALEARERRIQEALDGASRERDEATRLLEQQRKLLDESRDQAQQILADGRKAGERMRSELLEEARRQREQIVGNAKEDIERERDQALEVLRREAVNLSISAAGRVLELEVDSSENRRLVEEYLEDLARESGREKSG
ncbi:MAG: F0F1 ATP synthase subunit B [Gemmatimonadota bacterium]|nr:MAG: F0F1 ATP synthase subunit B [Gemmatimonadota bacterium]